MTPIDALWLRFIIPSLFLWFWVLIYRNHKHVKDLQTQKELRLRLARIKGKLMEQNTLPAVDMVPRNKPPRPTARTAEQVRLIAYNLTTELVGAPTEDEMQELLDDVEDADSAYADVYRTLMENPNWDGYKLANVLDGEYHWEVDSETVETMDGAYAQLHRLQTAAVKEWVEKFQLKPIYSVGQEVRITHQRKEYVGVIKEVKADVLTYVVYVQELGHVETGLGTHGLVIEEEQIRAHTSSE